MYCGGGWLFTEALQRGPINKHHRHRYFRGRFLFTEITIERQHHRSG